MRTKILALTPVKKLFFFIHTSKLLPFLIMLYSSYTHTEKKEEIPSPNSFCSIFLLWGSTICHLPGVIFKQFLAGHKDV